MLDVPYINYKELDEFYTINETCELLHLDKTTLRKKCEQYGIQPFYRRSFLKKQGYWPEDR